MGDRLTGEVGIHGAFEVVEDCSTLLCAGRHHRPDAFAPLATRSASRALGDPAIDDHEANGLLGQVVCRGYARRGDDTEIRSPVKSKTFGEIPGLPTFLGGGMTQSLEGGLDEFEEFLDSLAIWPESRAT